jgi:hypothetical protein
MYFAPGSAIRSVASFWVITSPTAKSPIFTPYGVRASASLDIFYQLLNKMLKKMLDKMLDKMLHNILYIIYFTFPLFFGPGIAIEAKRPSPGVFPSAVVAELH